MPRFQKKRRRQVALSPIALAGGAAVGAYFLVKSLTRPKEPGTIKTVAALPVGPVAIPPGVQWVRSTEPVLQAGTLSAIRIKLHNAGIPHRIVDTGKEWFIEVPQEHGSNLARIIAATRAEYRETIVSSAGVAGLSQAAALVLPTFAIETREDAQRFLDATKTVIKTRAEKGAALVEMARQNLLALQADPTRTLGPGVVESPLQAAAGHADAVLEAIRLLLDRKIVSKEQADQFLELRSQIIDGILTVSQAFQTYLARKDLSWLASGTLRLRDAAAAFLRTSALADTLRNVWEAVAAVGRGAVSIVKGVGRAAETTGKLLQFLPYLALAAVGLVVYGIASGKMALPGTAMAGRAHSQQRNAPLA